MGLPPRHFHSGPDRLEIIGDEGPDLRNGFSQSLFGEPDGL